MRRIHVAVVALAAIPFVVAQSPLWGQCGGRGYTGATTCVAGAVCMELNEWYFQCLPGATSQPPSTVTPPPPNTPTTPPVTETSPTITSTSPANPTRPPIAGFVKTSGQGFTANGQKFTVAGTNAYWLAQVSNADIDKAFSDIAAAGLTTVRTWGFNDVTSRLNYGAYYQVWQNGQATFNTGDYGISRFDYVVQSAKAHGIRLIVPLTNNWGDYGGMDVYVSQLGGGTHDAFYTNQRIISAYQNYIKTFVTRYVNEPTIMAWELANEPRCKGSTGSTSSSCTPATVTQWATTISAYIKSIDPNHLVAIGDEGFFQGMSGGYPYNANEGVDFAANIKIPSIDFGTFHAYPESWGVTSNIQQWGVDWINAHATIQKSANKPVLIEEFGVTSNQATVYSAWLDTIISSGLTGFNIWQAGSQLSSGASPNDGYAVYPNTDVYTLLKNAASRLSARA